MRDGFTTARANVAALPANAALAKAEERRVEVTAALAKAKQQHSDAEQAIARRKLVGAGPAFADALMGMDVPTDDLPTLEAKRVTIWEGMGELGKRESDASRAVRLAKDAGLRPVREAVGPAVDVLVREAAGHLTPLFGLWAELRVIADTTGHGSANTAATRLGTALADLRANTSIGDHLPADAPKVALRTMDLLEASRERVEEANRWIADKPGQPSAPLRQREG